MTRPITRLKKRIDIGDIDLLKDLIKKYIGKYGGNIEVEKLVSGIIPEYFIKQHISIIMDIVGELEDRKDLIECVDDSFGNRTFYVERSSDRQYKNSNIAENIFDQVKEYYYDLLDILNSDGIESHISDIINPLNKLSALIYYCPVNEDNIDLWLDACVSSYVLYSEMIGTPDEYDLSVSVIRPVDIGMSIRFMMKKMMDVDHPDIGFDISWDNVEKRIFKQLLTYNGKAERFLTSKIKEFIVSNYGEDLNIIPADKYLLDRLWVIENQDGDISSQIPDDIMDLSFSDSINKYSYYKLWDDDCESDIDKWNKYIKKEDKNRISKAIMDGSLSDMVGSNQHESNGTDMIRQVLRIYDEDNMESWSNIFKDPKSEKAIGENCAFVKVGDTDAIYSSGIDGNEIRHELHDDIKKYVFPIINDDIFLSLSDTMFIEIKTVRDRVKSIDSIFKYLIELNSQVSIEFIKDMFPFILYKTLACESDFMSYLLMKNMRAMKVTVNEELIKDMSDKEALKTAKSHIRAIYKENPDIPAGGIMGEVGKYFADYKIMDNINEYVTEMMECDPGEIEDGKIYEEKKYSDTGFEMYLPIISIEPDEIKDKISQRVSLLKCNDSGYIVETKVNKIHDKVTAIGGMFSNNAIMLPMLGRCKWKLYEIIKRDMTVEKIVRGNIYRRLDGNGHETTNHNTLIYNDKEIVSDGPLPYLKFKTSIDADMKSLLANAGEDKITGCEYEKCVQPSEDTLFGYVETCMKQDGNTSMSARGFAEQLKYAIAERKKFVKENNIGDAIDDIAGIYDVGMSINRGQMLLPDSLFDILLAIDDGSKHYYRKPVDRRHLYYYEDGKENIDRISDIIKTGRCSDLLKDALKRAMTKLPSLSGTNFQIVISADPYDIMQKSSGPNVFWQSCESIGRGQCNGIISDISSGNLIAFVRSRNGGKWSARGMIRIGYDQEMGDKSKPDFAIEKCKYGDNQIGQFLEKKLKIILKEKDYLNYRKMITYGKYAGYGDRGSGGGDGRLIYRK